MARFFTADLHLNSTNIIRYSDRPFATAEDAAKQLINNINNVCTQKSDILIHAGDFILTGVDRHDKIEDIPIDVNPESYIENIKCRLFLLDGNHDTQHSIETDAINMHIDLNHKWKGVFVNHFPSNHKWYKGPKGVNQIKINLCGHIHEKWFIYYDKNRNTLNYNVGVDIHNYKPIKDSYITEHLDFIFEHCFGKYNDNLINKCIWTMKDFKYFELRVKNDIKAERLKRKNERYQKKGLTKEDCDRRRTEAMQLKNKIKSVDQ